MSGSIRRPLASIDMTRIARAVAFPGIDPRGWVSLAIVTAVAMDADHGPFVDVVLHPSEYTGTARVGAEAAFGGGGQWWPIHPDDEVLVTAPDGDPAHGLVVTRRLWSAADLPPQLAVTNPDDVLLQAPDGRNLRLVVTGGFATFVAPDVRLGTEGAEHPLAFGEALVQTMAYGVDQAQIACVGPLAPLKVPLLSLVKALGFAPGSVPKPSGYDTGVELLSDICKTS